MRAARQSTADRSHLSIGEVLALLQYEFPDITISKIRFLESQGLIDPERTPSGYRKFYEEDIARLRWILLQQRDKFLPLKVIKDRLREGIDREELQALGLADAHGVDGAAEPPAPSPRPSAAPPPERVSTEPAEAAHAAPAPIARPAPEPPAAPAEAAQAPASPPGPGQAEQASLFAASHRPAAPQPDHSAPSEPAASEPAAERSADASAESDAEVEAADEARRPDTSQSRPSAAPPLLDAGVSGVSMSAEELLAASGLRAPELADLERFGLVVGRIVSGAVVYDEDSLVIAQLAVQFLRQGIEARHLRMYKVAAEREVSFYEQVTTPLLRRRTPARQEAVNQLAHLAEMGEGLRRAMVRRAVRQYLGGD